jgi:mannose/fructose/N-acetylgalactosamine-specific phosphotransferase system component IIB
MSIVLQRVDERLIHGQVVIGWGMRLHVQRFIVVDDELASSDWEQELYEIALGEEAEAIFLGVAEAAVQLAEWRADDTISVLLTRSLHTMRRLSDLAEFHGTEVNLGGIHDAPGRCEVASYLHLDDTDRADIQALIDHGADVSGRDLPEARRVGSDVLLATR